MSMKDKMKKVLEEHRKNIPSGTGEFCREPQQVNAAELARFYPGGEPRYQTHNRKSHP